MRKDFLILATLLMVLPVLLKAQILERRQDASETEIGIIEKTGTYLSSDLIIKGTDGQEVVLFDLLNKPTVIALVYFTCQGTCPPFMEEIAGLISQSKLVAGTDYQILTISFDHRDTPEIALENRLLYHELIEGEFSPDGWRFFVADSLQIQQLTQTMGFRFKPTNMDYLHTSSLIFVSENGRIIRYLHGTRFMPLDLKLAVGEAVDGKPPFRFGYIWTRLYSYDPAGQQYVLNITRIGGSIVLIIALIVFLMLTFVRARKKLPKQKANAAAEMDAEKKNQ